MVAEPRDVSLKRLAMIPGSKLVVLPNAGHMTFVDQPELFVQSIRDFVR